MNEKLEFLTKHFLVLSAAATIFGSAVTIIFVTGYLYSFDPSLIWIVEYSDMLKFAIIGTALFAASAGLIIGYWQDTVMLLNSQGKAKWIMLTLLSVGIGAYFIIPAVNHYYSSEYIRMFSELFLLCVVAMFMITVYVLDHTITEYRNGIRISASSQAFNLILIISVLFLAGYAYGISIKASKKDVYELVIKDKSNSELILQKSRIIMHLSHHTIVESGGRLVVVPSGDIARISAPAKFQ